MPAWQLCSGWWPTNKYPRPANEQAGFGWRRSATQSGTLRRHVVLGNTHRALKVLQLHVLSGANALPGDVIVRLGDPT